VIRIEFISLMATRVSRVVLFVTLVGGSMSQWVFMIVVVIVVKERAFARLTNKNKKLLSFSFFLSFLTPSFVFFLARSFRTKAAIGRQLNNKKR